MIVFQTKASDAFISLQAIRDGMSKAQQEVSGASSEQARAEAQIAVECFEALEKALAKS